MSFWMVRAGRNGAWIDLFQDNNCVAVGFGDRLGDAALDMDPTTLRNAYTEAYPAQSTGKVHNSVGQLYRFLHKIQSGDRILTYDAGSRLYLLGTVDSTPRFASNLLERKVWVRDVVWTHRVHRDELTQPTKNTLGSTLTLFRPKDIVVKELSDVQIKIDAPDSTPIRQPPAQNIEATEEAPQETVEEMQDRANQLIQDRLVALDWDQMEELVAGILRAMGYKTRISDPGPDRGFDVFASPDGLGLEEPRVFVEVKHRREKIGAPQLRSFLGGRHAGDRCMYVSTGGFTKDARYEADRSAIPLRLVDLPELTHLLLDHYPSLDAASRSLVPLAMLYWPLD